MDYRSLGVLVGAVIIFFAVFISLVFARKAKKANEHYDERQMAVRGIGYRISTVTMIIFLFVYGTCYGLTKDLVSPQFVVFAIAFLGVVVYSIYCIINDAYIQVGQNPKKWMAVIALVIAANTFSALNSSESGLTVNGLATGAALNVLIIISFSVILITILIKTALDKRGGSNEES